MHPPFEEPAVANVFDRAPAGVKSAMMGVRTLIFEEAEQLGCGPLTETLKWGEPAYLTAATKSGTTLRLAPRSDTAYALFVPCQTDIIQTLRQRHGPALRFEGTRAVVFEIGSRPPETLVRDVIAHALTYKWRKRGSMRQ